MSEHGPASTSEMSSTHSQPIERQGSSKSTEMLTQAREQVSRAGDYVSRNVAQYPFEALLLAGLIGYGIGFLIHKSWAGEQRQQTSAPEGHSGDVLRPLK